MEIYSHNLSHQDYDMWPFRGLRDLLRIEKTSFYGYGGYVYEIVDEESSGVIVVITPCACARGKVIGRIVVVVVVVIHKKIARSWDLGTLAARKYNKSVEIGEKLALGCLESSGTVYKLHK